MRMKHLVPFLAAALLAACSHPVAPPQPRAELASPDGTLRMEFSLDEAGTPFYSLSRQGTAVLLPSRLGFALRGTVKAEQLAADNVGNIIKSDAVPGIAFDCGFELAGTDTDSFDEVWEPVWGEESRIRNHYNELLVHLRQPDSGRLLDIRFRLFDDGLGFRYEFPGGQSLVHFVIKEELTEFAMADDCTAWWIPGDYDTQEYEYNRTLLSEVAEHFQDKMRGNSSQTPFSTSGVQTSLQMKTSDGLYVNIHEAALAATCTVRQGVLHGAVRLPFQPSASGVSQARSECFSPSTSRCMQG